MLFTEAVENSVEEGRVNPGKWLSSARHRAVPSLWANGQAIEKQYNAANSKDSGVKFIITIR
jgi:hypothetical protein